MRRRIGRLIVVAAFLLLFFGFYSTDKIVQAKQYGEAKSDGDWTVFGTDMYSGVTGNVGIGDSAPDGKLEVNPDGTEDNGDEFVVDSNGNVGIGTTSPVAPLEVASDSFAGVTLSTYTSTADNPSELVLRRARGTMAGPNAILAGDFVGGIWGEGYAAGAWHDSAGFDFVAAENWTDEAQGSYIQFLTVPNGTGTVTDAMRIDHNGNVGIGTSSPGYKLDVNGDINFTGTLRQNGNPFGGGTGVWSLNGSTAYYNAGNVGIGTTSPHANTKLHVESNSTNGTVIVLQNTDTGGETWELSSTGSHNSGGAGNLNFWQSPMGSALYLTSTGNVGIGDTTPTEAKLVVNGTAANATGVWSVLSDRRVKKDIHPLEGSLSKVLSLQGISFHWKDSERGAGLQRGFLAQVVENVIPEWVKTDDDGYKRLEKVGVEALLVEAIKELKAEKDAEIATLRAENKQLRGTLTALADRQEVLENMLIAISTTLPKEKLVKLDQLNSDEVQKAIQ